MTNSERTAVVLGASLGGLFSAVALAETFGEVVLVERDELPDNAVARRGVPQAQHAHGLLAGGLAALEQLLPGLTDELLRLGCPSGDNLLDAAWVFGGRRLAIGESGVRGMTVARPVLEQAVRRRVLGLHNVRLREGLRATGLLYAGGRVRGVRLAETASSHARVLEADLVVDATGRRSELPEWLAALGLAPPTVDEVALETRYVSRVYARRPHHLGGAIALMIVSDPSCPRGGIALALDEHRWLVSQYALGAERPPSDPEGFAKFARTLPGPQLARLLEDSEPRSDPATLRFPSSVRRRYEWMRGFPEGLLVCADALSSFNPTFGQGITVAAKEALALRALRAGEGRPGLARAFFRQASEIIDVAWNASVGRTFLYDGVQGRPTLPMRLGNVYMPRVLRAAYTDPVVATALLRALHFVDPPGRLFAPRVLWRSLRAAESPRAADLVPERGALEQRA